MDRKKRNVNKLKSSSNGDKSPRFKTISKLRSLSIPRSLSKNKRQDARKNSEAKLSNTSSGSLSPETQRNIFSKMTKSSISNESHEKIEMNSIHDDIFLDCENNLQHLKLTSESNTPVPPNDLDNPLVKLRATKQINEIDPDPEYYTCKSKFSPPVSPYSCRDSLCSITSMTSISSLSSQVSYEFSTHDRQSITAYGIEVNPVNQLVCAQVINDDSQITSQSSLFYNEDTRLLEKKVWTVSDLKSYSEIFNQNIFGLTTEMKQKNNEEFLLGTVRVYINLLRPIQMEFTPRPSSIFDVLGYNSHMEDHNAEEYKKVETLWLPRGTSKRLFVDQSTPTREVINALLNKFHIRGNHKSFGLYDHTIQGERKVSVRKIGDTECPLATMLSWTTQGPDRMNEIMSVHRLVLQENETGGIEWNGFLRPELENFLKILQREEDEGKMKIQLKYSILKTEIMRLLQDKANTNNTNSAVITSH